MLQTATSARRSSRFQTLRTHPFWDTRDVVLYMLRFLGLAHIVLFSHIDGRCKAYATMYLKGRITRYLSPFFTRSRYNGPPCSLRLINLVRFFAVLEETKSWIVGSVPLAVASTLSDVPFPSNLNIITYALRYPVWRDFFIFQARFRILERYWSTGPYASAGRLVVVFAHPEILNYTISITMSAASNLGKLFFASPNTDQLIAISSHALMTPVLANVSLQQHIMGWRAGVRRHPLMEPDPEDSSTHYREVPRFPGATTLDASTASWLRPCGPSCPGTPRITYGLTDFAHIKWGGLDDRDVGLDYNLGRIGQSRLSFRFGVRCDNQFCTESDSYVPPASDAGEGSEGEWNDDSTYSS
ncbi:hypothetical protein DFH06DRAFT_1345114 [Mycena polygramma]|nr:hypothetical protein DFH06DRAFT_1345114 [Mycena polygramma]